MSRILNIAYLVRRMRADGRTEEDIVLALLEEYPAWMLASAREFVAGIPKQHTIVGAWP